MKKEVFLYNYLIKYNFQESLMKEETKSNIVSEGWEEYDKQNETSGLIFFSLRNKLAHDTFNTLKELDESDFEYEEILKDLEDLKLEDKQQIDYIEFIISSSNLETELTSKGYDLYVCASAQNPYRCYSKQFDSGLRINIFFHHRAKFISSDVSTYNHNVPKGRKEYYKNQGLYIESEYYKGNIGCRIFLDEGDIHPTQLELAYEFSRKKNEKFIVESNFIGTSKMEGGLLKSFSNRSLNKESQLTLEELKEKIEGSFNIEEIEKICSEVKQHYNKIKGVIRKIGMYLD